MEQEHQLKSLLTEQQFEDAENKEFMLAQARACANGYALATEGIAVVSDFQNNECHIYSGRFGQTIMDFPEYMVDHTSAFENTVFSHANEEELIQRHILQSPNQKIPDRKTKCVIKTHINIKQNVIFGAKLKPV